MEFSETYDLRLVPFTGGHEGKVLRWYRDPTGTPTIGFGFTWGSKVFREWFLASRGRKMQPGDTITEAEALALLGIVIETEYLPPVLAAIREAKASVSLNAVSASTDMAYNCGKGALGWSWFKALLKGDLRDAAARYKVTATTSKGRTLPGLIRRRKEGALILEHDVWPSWVKLPGSLAAPDVAKSLPDWRLLPEDFEQGLKWLKELGYLKGGMGEPDVVTAAVLAFQKEHPQLTNDGILGRATLDQLQRVVDLKRKAAVSTAGGAVTSGAGTGETVTGTDVTGLDAWLLWAGGAIIVVALAWLAWRYRDEISIAVRSLFKRKEKRA